MQAIRLVRGTNPSGSSFIVRGPSAFFGLPDRPLEVLSLGRRERSLKKSSLGDAEPGAILLVEKVGMSRI
jgi:hypothetical protein